MTNASGSGNRQLSSWIDGFIEYTKHMGSPPLWRKWAAISTIAGALERKVWIDNAKGHLYPNVYVILVGPAGIGKSLMTNQVYNFLRELKTHHVAPTNTSRAGFTDALMRSERVLAHAGKMEQFHAINIISNELGTFLPEWDGGFISVLTDIWDGKVFDEEKRSQKTKIHIAKPWVNFLGATTPTWLLSKLPVTAWDEGITSRMIFCYNGERTITPIFVKAKVDDTLHASLVNDLKNIAELQGGYSFSDEAMDAIEAWNLAECPPVPKHPKLLGYTTRRITHLLKLCVIVAAARHNDRVVDLDDYNDALAMLLEVERHMPEIFLAMVRGGDSSVMDDTHNYVVREHIRLQRPVPKPFVMKFVSQRTPSHNVARIIEVMTQAGYWSEEPLGFVPHEKPTF